MLAYIYFLINMQFWFELHLATFFFCMVGLVEKHYLIFCVLGRFYIFLIRIVLLNMYFLHGSFFFLFLGTEEIPKQILLTCKFSIKKLAVRNLGSHLCYLFLVFCNVEKLVFTF